MHLKELVVNSYRQNSRALEFNFSVNCVSDLYFQCLPKKIDTSPFKKIIVTAVDINSVTLKPYDNMIDVVTIRVPFDFTDYWNASNIDRKKKALDLIQQGLLTLAREFEWENDFIKNAHDDVLKKNFINRVFWKKHIPSPNRKHKAQYFIDFDCDEIRIWAVIMDGKGEEIRREFISTVKPHWFFIDDTLSSIEWKDEETIIVLTKDKTQTWLVKATSN